MTVKDCCSQTQGRDKTDHRDVGARQATSFECTKSRGSANKAKFQLMQGARSCRIQCHRGRRVPRRRWSLRSVTSSSTPIIWSRQRPGSFVKATFHHLHFVD
ncbi:hypothetical protein MPTK1_3g02480 [Marchantia polymorpha subsp. ruderalis]|uniref:Uncharacterized protein n=2 Tax=Marchantia polymorpha TaxID=3197 RepID=A0AAF6AWQ3_MARPO|nr:hypothetical protein MARPO_0007s0237 [Marchantia polymorpha]BBN04187.1 hypothetical protein Mp_3g02480 [Marchantia polymorpha subsp. ruderalis]|eukprot:PTQ47874.1 hypothetical protein MARPO_0007s0237 [Marchantia polymorpha]